MAKITTTDFGTIHDALNRMIINEVKASVRLLPEKTIGERTRTDNTTALCRVVVSGDGDYAPRDLAVWCVWLDDEDRLHFSGGVGYDPSFPDEYDENDDMLDITDFSYLIERIRNELPDGEYDITSEQDAENLRNAMSNSMQTY